jgi:hypothetical protein
MRRARRDRGSCPEMPLSGRRRCIRQCERGSHRTGEIRGSDGVVQIDHAENESRGLLLNISMLV